VKTPSEEVIAFVRAGEKPTPAARATSSGLLSTEQDWELKVDLGKQLKFPETAAECQAKSIVFV